MSGEAIVGVLKVSAGTSTSWNNTNTPIDDRVLCIERDTGRAKLGDGETLYANLPYILQAPELPIGSVITTTLNTVPYGFVEADGALLLRSAYAELFAAVSGQLITEAAWAAGDNKKYSEGDGVLSFRVPNLPGDLLTCIKAYTL